MVLRFHKFTMNCSNDVLNSHIVTLSMSAVALFENNDWMNTLANIYRVDCNGGCQIVCGVPTSDGVCKRYRRNDDVLAVHLQIKYVKGKMLKSLLNPAIKPDTIIP